MAITSLFRSGVLVLFTVVLAIDAFFSTPRVFESSTLFSSLGSNLLNNIPSSFQPLLTVALGTGSLLLASRILENQVVPHLARPMALLALAIYEGFPLRDFLRGDLPESLVGLSLNVWPRPSLSLFLLLLVIMLTQRSLVLGVVRGSVIALLAASIWIISPAEAILATAYLLITIASRAWRSKVHKREFLPALVPITIGTFGIGIATMVTRDGSYVPDTNTDFIYELLVGASIPTLLFFILILVSRLDLKRKVWEARGPLTLVALEIFIVVLATTEQIPVSAAEFMKSSPVLFLHIYLWSIVAAEFIGFVSKVLALSPRYPSVRYRSDFETLLTWVLAAPLFTIMALYLVVPLLGRI